MTCCSPCSCLIARNLLNGLKTCSEVYNYMTHLNSKLSIEGRDDGTNLECNDPMVSQRFLVLMMLNVIFCDLSFYCLVHTMQFRVMKSGEDQDMLGGEAEFVVWSILGSPLVIIPSGSEFQRGKINLVDSIILVGVNLLVESSVLVF